MVIRDISSVNILGKVGALVMRPLKAAVGSLARFRKVRHLKVAAQRQRPSWSRCASSFS